MDKINIFIGSESGTAELAALTLADKLNIATGRAVTHQQPSLQTLTARLDGLLLIVTSTAGQGELPRNLRPLWRKLNTQRPDLTGLHYAVAVLGDPAYGQHFCLGGISLDALLGKLGGNRLQTPLLIDSDSTDEPETLVSQWGLALSQQHQTLAVCC